MVAGTITVNQQMRARCGGHAQGQTRRTVPMTALLWDALSGCGDEGRTGDSKPGCQAKSDENQMKTTSPTGCCRLAVYPGGDGTH